MNTISHLLLAMILQVLVVITFTASIPLIPSHASASSDNAIPATLTAPVLKDLTGQVLVATAKANQMIMISVTLTGNDISNSSIPFVIIVEARDGLSVTQYSQFAVGSLNSNGNGSEVALSWTPKAAGKYELRAFALSNMNDPQILALPQSTLTTIEQ